MTGRDVALVALGVGVVGTVALAHADDLSGGGHPFATGDYGVHTAAGLVRRGVAGDVLVAFARLGTPFPVVALTVSLAAFAAFVTAALLLHARREEGFELFAVTANPAFLLFAPNDPDGALRKEVLGLAVVACLALACARRRLGPPAALAGALALAYAVLAHEVNAVLVPFAWALVRRAASDGTLGPWIARGFYAISGSAVGSAIIIAVVAPGTVAQADAICASLRDLGAGPSSCEGALRWLAYPASAGAAVVRAELLPNALYLFSAALALVPVVRVETLRLVARPLGAATAVALPVFALGSDWGRWVSVLVSGTFLVSLAVAPRGGLGLARREPAFVALYVLSWGMPHASAAFGDGVLVNLARAALR